MSMLCTMCQSTNPAGMKFCGYCGTPLTAALAAAAELRSLTVLFCDLVGSTALAETLDPEDLREITAAYHVACDAAITRHDGHIAQYLGDGILVYFGYPAAHDDDARRAVRAALGIISGVAAVSARIEKQRGIRLAVRVGVHTGPVVVGEVGSGERRERLALGKTPNLAARIQGLAEPGSVVISGDTWRIAQGFFDFASLGSHEIKGLSGLVELHQVLGETTADSRLDVARRVGLAPLMGREQELARIEAQWRRVSSGGHAVMLQGEAGIGKSRIVDALRVRAVAEAATVLESTCSAYAQNTPLDPIIGLVERTLGINRDATAAERYSTLEAQLAKRSVPSPEELALFAHLLALPLPGEDATASYSPQKRRERTLDVLRVWLLTSVENGAALFVMEDLHWADPTTLEFVTSLIASVSGEPLLMVLTSRPDFVAPWHAHGRVSNVVLSRLNTHATEALATRVAGGKSLPSEVLEQIVNRTEGVPLFVEEITKAVLELGVLVEHEDRFELKGPLPHDLIPSTIQGSLNARLDRMGDAKTVAQVAATIGREFRYDLLCIVAQQSEASLRSSVDRLLGAELVYQVTAAPEETYIFKHALIQDTAYHSLLKKTRREIHELVGDAIASRFPELAEQRPELLAEHFSRAARAEDAIKFWLLAGQRSIDRAANHEAIAHLQRGLALTPELPAAGLERELDFLIALVPALIAAQGWASPEIDRVYRRAGELLDLLGDSPHRMTFLIGSMGYHFVAGRVARSGEIAHQVLDIGLAVGDPFLITLGRQECCAAHCYGGDFVEAIEHGDAALAILDLDRERYIGRILGLSAAVGILAYQVLAWWSLGYPEKSRQAGDRCLALAREIGHTPSIGFALTSKVATEYLQGEWDRALKVSTEALRVAHEERLGFWDPMINVMRGAAMARLGDSTGGATLIREAIEQYYAAGNAVQQVFFHALFAETLWRDGQRDAAFAAIAHAMKVGPANGEGLYEPELYRLDGEFLYDEALRSTSSADRNSLLQRAEERIGAALEIARPRSAKMYELRALATLCRIHEARGNPDDARRRLARVIDSFTEGFEHPDLRAAKGMLSIDA